MVRFSPYLLAFQHDLLTRRQLKASYITSSFGLRVPHLETLDGKFKNKLSCYITAHFMGNINLTLASSVNVVVASPI